MYRSPAIISGLEDAYGKRPLRLNAPEFSELPLICGLLSTGKRGDEISDPFEINRDQCHLRKNSSIAKL